MKKLLFLVLLLVVLSFFGYRFIRQQVRNDLTAPVAIPTSTPTPKLKQVKGLSSSKYTQTLFVPYWTLGDQDIDTSEYKSVVYFGITPGDEGIDRSETGFKDLDSFLSSVPSGTDKKLAVRMTDSTQNFAILKDSAKQSSIIKDSIEIAKQNGFSGVVLDLEVSAVPFDSLIDQINEFVQRFYKQTKSNNLSLDLMLYGDSFYRIRPFDVKTLSKNADEFMIMSYDFSKSRGNPGPNFPLHGKEVYGYDMTKIADDFLQYLPPEKTSIVFGLFGYDWIVDDNNQAQSTGAAKTYTQIQKEFLSGCPYANCDIKRKNDSVETEITYTDSDNKKHVVWFEDPDSVDKKEKYLLQRGINNFSFWAYSYF